MEVYCVENRRLLLLLFLALSRHSLQISLCLRHELWVWLLGAVEQRLNNASAAIVATAMAAVAAAAAAAAALATAARLLAALRRLWKGAPLELAWAA